MGVSSGGLYLKNCINYFDFTSAGGNRSMMHSSEWSFGENYPPNYHVFEDMMRSDDEIKLVYGDSPYSVYGHQRVSENSSRPLGIAATHLTGPEGSEGNTPPYESTYSSFLVLQNKGGGPPRIARGWDYPEHRWAIEMWVELSCPEGGSDNRDNTLWHGGTLLGDPSEDARLSNVYFQRGSSYTNSYHKHYTAFAENQSGVDTYNLSTGGTIADASVPLGFNYLPDNKIVHITYRYFGFNVGAIYYNGRRISQDAPASGTGNQWKRISAPKGLYLFGHPTAATVEGNDVPQNSSDGNSTVAYDYDKRSMIKIYKIRVHQGIITDDQIRQNYEFEYKTHFRTKSSIQPDGEGPFEDY